MPGKVNPVIPEVVTQVAAQVIGNDTAITVGGMGGHFELNVYVPLMARNLLDSIGLLASASRLLAEKCVDGIEANRERNEQLRREHALGGDRAQPVHRLRQGDRDREGGGRVGPPAPRGRARGRRGRGDPRRGARLPRDGKAARLSQVPVDGRRRLDREWPCSSGWAGAALTRAGAECGSSRAAAAGVVGRARRSSRTAGRSRRQLDERRLHPNDGRSLPPTREPHSLSPSMRTAGTRLLPPSLPRHHAGWTRSLCVEVRRTRASARRPRRRARPDGRAARQSGRATVRLSRALRARDRYSARRRSRPRATYCTTSSTDPAAGTGRRTRRPRCVGTGSLPSDDVRRTSPHVRSVGTASARSHDRRRTSSVPRRRSRKPAEWRAREKPTGRRAIEPDVELARHDYVQWARRDTTARRDGATATTAVDGTFGR